MPIALDRCVTQQLLARTRLKNCASMIHRAPNQVHIVALAFVCAWPNYKYFHRGREGGGTFITYMRHVQCADFLEQLVFTQ